MPMSLYLVHIILILIVVTSFHLHIRNVNEVIWQFWDGENSLFVTQGTSQFLCASQFFPIHGLAVVVKKNSSPLVEEFFFTTPAKPFMGKICDLHRNWNVPFVTHRKFQNTLLAASPLVEYFPVPKSPNDSICTIPRG